MGKKYEMYIPVAHELEKIMGVVFADAVSYQFTCHGISMGHFWTKDIHYTKAEGKPTPPPAHPIEGSPFLPSAAKAIRLATDE